MEDNLSQMLQEYDFAVDVAANGILLELKSKCKNYKQLGIELMLFEKRNIYGFDNRPKYESLFYRIRELIEEEKNDMPLKIEEQKKATDAADRLPNGKSSINQIRVKYGLKPIEDDAFNAMLITKE